MVTVTQRGSVWHGPCESTTTAPAMPALVELASFTVRYVQTAAKGNAACVRFSSPYTCIEGGAVFPAEVFELSRAHCGNFCIRHVETRPGGPNPLWGLIWSAGVFPFVDDTDECQMKDSRARLTKVVLSMEAAKEGARVVIGKRIFLQKEGNGELSVRRV
jgi:hypothetical protein